MTSKTRSYNNNWQSYLSLGLWPVLTAFIAYYTYFSFDVSMMKPLGINNTQQLLVFIFTGLLGYNCFWSMVQSALFIQRERENGTLEIVFLSPAPRMGFIYGRAMGGIIQNVWLFSLFTICIMLLNIELDYSLIYLIPIGFFIMLISAIIWGGFINSIFLVSRDVDFWFTLCDSPMELLSGAKIPLTTFPLFMKYFSVIFPLTHCLIVTRTIFLERRLNWEKCLILLAVLIVLISITKIVLSYAEKSNRKNGGFQFY